MEGEVKRDKVPIVSLITDNTPYFCWSSSGNFCSVEDFSMITGMRSWNFSIILAASVVLFSKNESVINMVSKMTELTQGEL
jgi:hypothetical protein